MNMITNISSCTAFKATNATKANPSFGLAKLNETGARTADTFGFQRNEFLNDRLFEKQGLFKKAAISSELSAGKNFVDICNEYGCSPMAGANAAFIQNQILSKKGNSATKGIDQAVITQGLMKLYENNYDNPELSLKDTKALLEKVKESMAPGAYIQNIGLLEAGTDK